MGGAWTLVPGIPDCIHREGRKFPQRVSKGRVLANLLRRLAKERLLLSLFFLLDLSKRQSSPQPTPLSETIGQNRHP